MGTFCSGIKTAGGRALGLAHQRGGGGGGGGGTLCYRPSTGWTVCRSVDVVNIGGLRAPSCLLQRKAPMTCH